MTIFVEGTAEHLEPEWRAKLRFLLGALAQRQLVPLLGAGISMDWPASLPSGAELEDPLRMALVRASHTYLPSVGASELDTQMAAFRLEPMLEALQQVHGRELIEDYLAPIDRDTWNANHAIIAALATADYIRNCITLNFDRLLELAVLPDASRICCPLLNSSFDIGSGSIRLHVTKLHGSFGKPEGRIDDLLCGALSEIGDRPSDANRQAIVSILKNHPTLFVAGYSNNDWDIGPILFDLRSVLHHIIWVEHAEDPLNHEPNERQRIVRSLLREFDIPHTLVVARTGDLLQLLAREFKVTPRPCPKGSSRPTIDASPFVLDSMSQLRSAAAAVLLLPNNPTRESLLSKLREADNLHTDTRLQALLTKASGMGDYSHVRGMTRTMNRVARLSRGDQSRPLTDDSIWRGYQYLRRLVRPAGLIDFLIVPNIVRVVIYFRRSIAHAARERDLVKSLAQRDYIDSLVTRARYFYPAQIPHGWAENTMFFGGWTKAAVRLLLCPALHLYERAARDNFRMMESEYFWMRWFQARALAGLSFDNDASRLHLRKIERFFCDLHGGDHRFTVHLCEALIAHKEGSMKLAGQYLLSAMEDVRSRPRPDIGSLLRILFYQRYLLGQPTLRQGIAEVWKMLRMRGDHA